ncbi:MAG: uroporphyrinogen decarboxylase family protein [Anaerolineae bacterium]|nr:uroporphyrinogen decarboxylase family protein [Anaerolineae bacterium]
MRPNFDRFRTAVLCRGEPDRVPLAEASIDAGIKEAVLGRPIRTAQDEVAFWAEAGYDFVPVHTGLRLMTGYGLTVDREAADERQALLLRNRRIGRARYGVQSDAELRRDWAEEGHGIITSREALERFPWPEADEFDNAAVFGEIAAALPPGMRIVAYQGHIFTPAWELMGFEAFCFALRDDPALVEALFERIGAIQYAIFQRVIAMPEVGAVWWPDDIAYTEGLMIAPQHLRRLLFPWLRRMGEDCAARGLPWIFHSDGDLTEVIDDLLDCGFNALHPIEAKAMDIVALKRRCAGRLALMGNVDLAYPLSLGTPEEVAAEVRRLLREVAPGGGYCLGSGNSVPEYVPLANYQAMRETALEYGGYPILG